MLCFTERIFMMNAYDAIYQQLLPRLNKIDLQKQAKNLGLSYCNNEIKVDFMGEEFIVTNAGITPYEPDGNALGVPITLAYYILSPGRGEVSHTFIARHHLSPMMVGMPYKPKTTEMILKAVKGDYNAFAKVAEKLGGEYRGMKKAGHMWVFAPLPKTPIAFTFVEADEDFSAELLITVPDNATNFLEYECLDGLVDIVVDRIRRTAEA